MRIRLIEGKGRRRLQRMLGRILPVLALAAILTQTVCATSEEPIILVFHEEGCPDCHRMEAVLQELLASYPDLSVARYEITQPGSSELFKSLADRYGVLVLKVPIIYVGEVAIVGAGRIQEMRLREAVEGCALNGCISPLRFSERGKRLSATSYFILGAVAISLLLLLMFSRE